MTESLALALLAGMLAAVNPCGFALLPAYLSLLILDDSASRATAVRRALVSAAALTLGFVGVFGLFGLVIAPIAAGVQQHLPWVTVIVGALLVLAGLWLLAGRTLPALGWSPRGPRLERRFGSMAAFGAVYATVSLTCTIAPFLAVVAATFRFESPLAGAVLFVAYGVGMGLLVGAAALAVALAKASAIGALRRAGGAVQRVMGGLLVVVGAYVGYYGWWELQVLQGAPADDPVIGLAAMVQSWLADAVRTLGVVGMAVAVLLLLAAAVLVRRRARDRRASPR